MRASAAPKLRGSIPSPLRLWLARGHAPLSSAVMAEATQADRTIRTFSRQEAGAEVADAAARTLAMVRASVSVRGGVKRADPHVCGAVHPLPKLHLCAPRIALLQGMNRGHTAMWVVDPSEHQRGGACRITLAVARQCLGA